MANPFRTQEVEVPPTPEGCLAPVLRRFIVFATLGLLISVAALGYIPFVGTANISGQQTVTTVGQPPQPMGRLLQLVMCYLITTVIGSVSWLFVSTVLRIRHRKVFLVLWCAFLALVFIGNGDWFVVVFVTVGGNQDNTLVYTSAPPWFVELTFRAIMIFAAFCLIVMFGGAIIGGLESGRESTEERKAQEQERLLDQRWYE